jgi:hypothetical protein
MSEQIELVPLSLAGQYIEVHPDAVQAHAAAGWCPAERRPVSSEAGESVSAMTVPQLKDALAAKGIEIPAGAKKDELQALHDATE